MRKRSRRLSLRKIRKIAVILDLGSSTGRGLLRGISQFSLSRRNWFIRIDTTDSWSMETVAAWNPEGIIAAVTTWPKIRELQSLKVPVVNVSGRVEDQPFPQVVTDHRVAGEMAANYFLDKGYRNFGMLVEPDSGSSRRRWAGFSDRLAAAGFTPSMCNLREEEGIYAHWEKSESPLTQWLQSLPKPAAIQADYDLPATLVNQMCMKLGIAVPEQVAILGMEDDELLCNSAYPPLSSIHTDLEHIGMEAAGILERLMAGGDPPRAPIRVPPLRVVTRGSTDILAIADEEVAVAVRFISQHACSRIQVTDVIEQVPASRRALERRFQKVMGRSLLQEIHRVRVDHAMFLLATSLMPMPQVARQSGFESSNRMWAVFRRVAKISPAAYRKNHRT